MAAALSGAEHAADPGIRRILGSGCFRTAPEDHGREPRRVAVSIRRLRDLFDFFSIPFEIPALLSVIVIVIIFGLTLNFAQRSTRWRCR